MILGKTRSLTSLVVSCVQDRSYFWSLQSCYHITLYVRNLNETTLRFLRKVGNIKLLVRCHGCYPHAHIYVFLRHIAAYLWRWLVNGRDHLGGAGLWTFKLHVDLLLQQTKHKVVPANVFFSPMYFSHSVIIGLTHFCVSFSSNRNIFVVDLTIVLV